MKKKSIVKNYLYNLAYQLLVMLLPLVTIPYVSRTLGAETIGIYSYTISITTYFITFGSLGIALYGQREIAFAQDDKEKISKIFFELILLRMITLAISLLIFSFTFVANGGEYSHYYSILMLEIVGSALDISWFFRGLEEFRRTVMRNTLVKIVSAASIFLFVRTPNDLPIYLTIYALSVLIGNLSLWPYLPKYVKKINLKSLEIFKHLRFTMALFVPQIAVQAYTLLDKTMIGTIISDKSEVGYYDQSQKIIKVLLTVITSLGVVMMPRIASIFAKGDSAKIGNYIDKSFRVVLLFSLPLIAGLCVISDSFVPFFFGDGFEKVSLLMKVISPIILFIGISNVTGTQYLLPTKQQRGYTVSVISGAATNFLLNLILIPKYGALGASLATVAAELSVTTIQLCYAKSKISILLSLRKSYIYPLASIIVLLLGYIIQVLLKPSPRTMVIQFIACSLTYGGILIITKDAMAKVIFNKTLSKFKAKTKKEYNE